MGDDPQADFWTASLGVRLMDNFRIARHPGGVDYSLRADSSGLICYR